MVTGATGFVRSNIVKALAQQGHRVIGLDLVAPDDLVKRYLQPWAERVSFVQGDILNVRDLERAAEDRDVTKIVHAAVYTGVSPDIEKERSRSIVDVNVVGTANLLDLARGLSLERFLYVSSGAVYGVGHSLTEPLREDTILYPRSLYAATKYASELLTHRYGELHGFQAVSVRLSSPYGPMERATGHRSLMSLLCQWTGNVVRGEPIKVGDRTQGRDFSYVADIAAGICAVLDAPSVSYDVYNVSTGHSITLDEIIETMQSLRPSVQVIDDPSMVFPSLGLGANRAMIDVTRLREDVGFTAQFGLASGISEYLKWREEFSFRD